MALEPIHYSRLKLMAESPAHYFARAGEDTYSKQAGSALHALVLGTQEVVAWDKVSENGNQCPRRGKDFDRFAADHPGALILTPPELAEAKAKAKAVQSNKLAMRVLAGEHEREVTWSFGGRDCAGRIDCFGPDYVTELKATKSANPRRFRKQARWMGYCGQLVWYGDGLTKAGLCIPEAYYIVAVEQTAPYVVTVFRLSQRDIDRGRSDYRGWFEQVLVCEQANEWPGYCQAIVELGAYDDDMELDFSGVEEAEAA